MELSSLVIFITIAMSWAFIGELLLPHSVPGGFLGATAIGFIGAWIGSSMLLHFGPDLAGVPLIPAVLGSVVLVFFSSLITGGHARTWQ